MEPAPQPDPLSEPCSAIARRVMLVGGLLCFAALWLPLFDDFVSMTDENGFLFSLVLVVPAFAVPRTTFGVRVIHGIMRLLLVGVGLVGVIAIMTTVHGTEIGSGIAALFFPAPLASLAIGVIGPRLGRLAILITTVMLFGCLCFIEDANLGLPVLAIGTATLLVGALLWGRKPLYDPTESETLPRAAVLRK